MTPSLFFRLMSWFAALVGCLLGGLAVLSILNGEVLGALVLLVVAAINIAGWRLFTNWSEKMRG